MFLNKETQEKTIALIQFQSCQLETLFCSVSQHR